MSWYSVGSSVGGSANRGDWLALVSLTIALLASTAAKAQSEAVEVLNPQPQIRYPLGPDSLKQAGVPEGKLEGPFLFQSKIIADTIRQYWVYVPAQYNAEQPACLLVFQDGARAINPNGVIRAPQVLENLIAAKKIPVTIGIFITPGQRGDEFPDSIGTGNPNNRDREYDVLNDAYARMVIEEILPEVGKKYRITDDPTGRTIGGSSSGGICAFTVAWERPDAFRNVVSFIGSFTNIHGGHVYPDLVREAEAKPIRIFLQDGINDLRSPDNLERDWYLQNQKMVAALSDKGYDMAYVFGEGGHSDDHGGAMLPYMLQWVWRDYPGFEGSADALVAAAKAIEPEKIELFPGFDAEAKTDPTGTFVWKQRLGDSEMINSLQIDEANGVLSGTYTTHMGDEAAQSYPLLSPQMDGNKLTFNVLTMFRDREMPSTFQGIIHDGKIVGWRMSKGRGQQRDSRWEAERE